MWQVCQSDDRHGSNAHQHDDIHDRAAGAAGRFVCTEAWKGDSQSKASVAVMDLHCGLTDRYVTGQVRDEETSQQWGAVSLFCWCIRAGLGEWEWFAQYWSTLMNRDWEGVRNCSRSEALEIFIPCRGEWDSKNQTISHLSALGLARLPSVWSYLW